MDFSVDDGMSVGHLVHDGDRFWFENDPAFTSAEKAELKQTKLSDLLNRNTGATFGSDSFRK